jgi:hypothetical protein
VATAGGKSWLLRLIAQRAGIQTGATASAGQAVKKVKVLLENAESEWANEPAAVERPGSSLNHRPDRVSKPVNHRADSVETLDGPLKSGERRILTALAQYPEGRSKVQVAVLTGYAANGGGFNNYLGALRSRGMIQGDGDRLTITDGGMEALGSWEPLPDRLGADRVLAGSVGQGRAINFGCARSDVPRSAH